MVQINQGSLDQKDKQQEMQPIGQIHQTFQYNDYNPNPSFNFNELENTYDLNRLAEFEKSVDQKIVNDRDRASDLNELQCYILPRWMPILLDLEIELKAIVYNRATIVPDFVTYINKRIVPMMDFFLNKQFSDFRKIKVQCYFNEITLLIQRIIFLNWKQYPQLCLTLLKKIFVFPDQKFYDSNFNEMQFFPQINNFYSERLVAGIQSEHRGKKRNSIQDAFSQVVYYPIENEILDQFQKNKTALYLSPLLRIQIHYFYKNGGFSLLVDGVANFNIQNIEILELLNYLSSFIDKQIFLNYFHGIRENLRSLYTKINEEDIKLSSKEQVKRLNETLERVLFPFYTMGEIREIVNLTELNIYLHCFKVGTLEKRIYGLQQICDKIMSLNMNDYINVDFAMMNDENAQKEMLLQFLVKNKIFSELFGEKAHFELIKRSSPFIRFLYRNHQLQTNEVVQILRMGKGKHESWSNLLFKILNDLAEIMSEQDMEALLSEIKEHKIDSNILIFIKSMGRNQNFEKKQFQQKKEVKDNNILTELDIDQESVQNVPKQSEKLIIKVYNEEQQQSENQYTVNRAHEKKSQQQQQQQEINVKRNFQDDDSIDTNYEEGEGIRGRIIEFLLSITNQQPATDIGNQAFKIALELICFQFKFLRIKYLNIAFSKLFENETASSIENQIMMIQRIVQSQYPIESYNTQSDLIKYLNTKYNFKLSFLVVIGKAKKKLYEQSKERYTEIIEALLKFYQFFYLLTDSKIQGQHLKIIWQLLVENAFCQKEQDLFFTWIFNQNKIIITQDALQMLLFDYLIKIDCNSYTIPMFDCLQNLLLYFNIQYKILKSDIDTFIIQNSDIIGIEILWKLFFQSNNKEIVNKVLQFLLQISNYKSQNQEIMNNLKKNYIEHLFSNISQQKVERCLDLCLKLLEEVEGMKYLKSNSFDQTDSHNQKISIIIDNRCKNAQHPKRQEISVPEGMKLNLVKQIIGQKINPQVRGNEIDLVYRGTWLENAKSLKDYKFDKKPTIQVLIKPQIEEVSKGNAPLAICLGDNDAIDQPPMLMRQNQNAIPMQGDILQSHQQSNGKANPSSFAIMASAAIPNKQVSLTAEQVEKINSVMEISGEANRNFVEYLLIDNCWNAEQSIMDLIENKDFYWSKFEEQQLTQIIQPQANQGKQQKQQSQQPQQQQQSQQVQHHQKQQQNEIFIPVEKFNIAKFISENNNYISQLFEILNQNNEQLNNRVWQILSMIPRNKETYEMIDQCQQTQDWDNIIDLQNKYKLYYNLQILKELLDCDFIDDQEELRKRKICRENFFLQGGLLQVQQLLFMEGIEPNIIQLALEIFLIYFTAYVLSQNEKQDDFIGRVLNLRETVRKQFRQFEEKVSITFFFEKANSEKSKPKSDSNSQSSGVSTPTFQFNRPTPPFTPPVEEHTIPKQQQADTFDERQLLIAEFKGNKYFSEHMNYPWQDILIALINKIDLGFEQIFQTLLLIVYWKPQLLNYIYQIQEFPVKVLSILTKSEQIETRRMITYTLIQICKINKIDNSGLEEKQEDFALYILKHLLPHVVNPKTDYDDLFILNTVVLQKISSQTLSQIVDLDLMSQQIIQEIINRPIIEQRFEDNEDKVVQGYMILLAAIIELCPQIKQKLSNQLINSVYESLFHLNDDYAKYPKFKRKLTRKRGFQLLIEASKNCEQNFLLLLDPISSTHGKFDLSDSDQETGVKGHYGFVGLKNLGATCYINSLLQQFFMNKTFRQGILNSQIMIYDDQNQARIFDNFDQITDLSIKSKLQDHTLHQLQQVFIQLQDSVKQFINPVQFIKTLQGYDGQPINFQVQSDVNEFFNLLTDKLEKDQKGTIQQDLIPQIMGGTLGHEIQSLEHDIEFQRETDEVFLTVTIEIKNKKNLEEALDLFIKADILDGENKYFCEAINRRIDVEKRCYFKKLPNTFIFTLKRFEFDYNRMLKLKVNDYFEFPSEINMFKWTKDHLINNLQIDDYTDYIYKLVGVLIHTGSADSGHYYSFINSHDNMWFEFNDKSVTPFKFENLKQECFGGNNNYSTDHYSNFDWDTNKSKNAYLLFYEKIDKQDIPILGTNEKCLQNRIIQENITYLRNQLFCSSDYQTFVREFVCQFNFAEQQEQFEINRVNPLEQGLKLQQIQESPSLKVIKLFTQFSLETLLKNKDTQEFVNSITLLCALYDKVPSASFWFLNHLKTNQALLVNLLIESSYAEVKHSFSKLLTQSISQVVALEDSQEANQKGNKSQIEQFFQFFYETLLPISKKTMRRASEFFQILKFAISTSDSVIKIFQKYGYTQQIYRLYKETINENTFYGNIMNISKLNEKGLEGTCSAMCEFLSKVILGCGTQGMMLSNEKSPTYLFKSQSQMLMLNSNLLKDLVEEGDYKKLFAPMVQLNSIVVDVTKHLCFNDINISEIIIEQLVSILLDWNMIWHQIDPIFHIIESILKIQDPYGEMRFQAIMDSQPKIISFSKGKSIPDAINQQFNNDKNFSFCLAVWIAELANNSQVVKDYFKENKSTIDQILNRLKKYKECSFYLNYPINKITKAIEQIQNLPFMIEDFNEKKAQLAQFWDEKIIKDQNQQQQKEEQGFIYTATSSNEGDDEYEVEVGARAQDKKEDYGNSECDGFVVEIGDTKQPTGEEDDEMN